MSLLGVSRSSSVADAYGVNASIGAAPFGDFSVPHPPDVMASLHLLISVNQDNVDRGSPGQVSEISFDEADIQGTFRVGGHPGVIGLWLASFTVADLLADPVPGVSTWFDVFDPTLYEVPDLLPAANGHMYRRGFVWDGGVLPRAYP